MIVKISYQTLLVPPPFSFAYTLELDFKADHIDIQYDLEFLNRNELSLEEIEAEGYSENDDYSWKGTLGQVWVEDLKNDLSQIELEEESEELNVYLHADITFDDGTNDSGLAVLAEDWDYRLQEVIQAIYEKDGVEQKLQMTCVNISKGEKKTYNLTGSFEHRTAAINDVNIPWDDMHEIIADIYQMEFDQEPVSTPKSDGLWIQPDRESGFQLFDGDTKAQERILNALSK